MAQPNVRLSEADNKLIEKVIKVMDAKGFVRPSAADAVRYALNMAATTGVTK